MPAPPTRLLRHAAALSPRPDKQSQRATACAEPSPRKMPHVVYFDMTIGGAPAGRIEMTLREDVVPKTAENFRCAGRRALATRARASTA